MTTATAAIRSDTVWLCLMDYRVRALNPNLGARASELQKALEAGAYAYPDPIRENFYDVELPTGWAYIHIRDDNRTVYLIAYSCASI